MFTGFTVTTPAGELHVTGRLLTATMDLPARAMVSQMKQFNGKYGCSVCTDEGTGRPGAPMQRYWPYTGTSTLRSHQSWLEDLDTTLETNQPVSIFQINDCMISLQSPIVQYLTSL